MAEVLKCPFCGNHCPQDRLMCGRGRRYFSAQEQENGAHIEHGQEHHRENGAGCDDEIVLMLRKCGHFLHHSGKQDAAVRSLTKEERETLLKLLEKCYAEWQEN